jgi:hypothetical protein
MLTFPARLAPLVTARDFVARRERRFGFALVLSRDHQRVREAEADGVNAQTDAAGLQRWRRDVAHAESRRRTEAFEDECAHADHRNGRFAHAQHIIRSIPQRETASHIGGYSTAMVTGIGAFVQLVRYDVALAYLDATSSNSAKPLLCLTVTFAVLQLRKHQLQCDAAALFLAPGSARPHKVHSARRIAMASCLRLKSRDSRRSSPRSTTI